MKSDPHHVTSVSYANPPRPLPVKLYNRAVDFADTIGLTRGISPARLMEKASRKSGLTDYGTNDFQHPFEILADSINHEARLNGFGRLVTRMRLLGVLKNRLRTEWFFSRYPEIEQVRLHPVVVITGLQRTGTTLLHRLLSSDPRFRALLSWEAINPAPFIDTNNFSDDRRFKKAKSAENALAYLSPDFFAVHPVEAESPEEDVILLDFAFRSTVPESTLRVPTYSKWLETVDHRPAYGYMARLLKLLQWQHSAERWILKSPHHLEYLDILLELFPNAKIIHTHRDPCTTLASFCSMISHGRGVFSDHVDPKEVGSHWARKVERLIGRTMEVRENAAKEMFLDIYYSDLISDPILQVERIYRFLDMELEEGTKAVMEESLRKNVQYRYGIHRYSLKWFGLSRDEIKERFSGYYKRYNIGEEERCEIPDTIQQQQL